MNCCRCSARPYYEFDGYAFCKPHGEVYLIEVRYAKAETRVTTYMELVKGECSWISQCYDDVAAQSAKKLGISKSLARQVEELSRMPKEQRMRILMGRRPIPKPEYEKINFKVDTSAYVKALTDFQQQMENMRQRQGALLARSAFKEYTTIKVSHT